MVMLQGSCSQLIGLITHRTKLLVICPLAREEGGQLHGREW